MGFLNNCFRFKHILFSWFVKLLFAKNRNFQDILRVKRVIYLELRLWPLSCCEGVWCYIWNTAHPEGMRRWVLLSDVAKSFPASQDPHRVAVPLWPSARCYRKKKSLLTTSKIHLSHSELESIKVTISQHFFLFSGQDALNGWQPKTGKIPMNNLKGFCKANQCGTMNVGNDQEMGN